MWKCPTPYTSPRATGPAPAPLPAIAPAATAWLLYTSGTMGRPKGVPITHRGALRLVHGIDTAVSADDTVLHFAPITFDASVFEIWMSLLGGAKLAIHPPGPPSLDELGAFLRQAGVTWAFLTTGLLRQMLEHNLGDLRELRQLVTGGEVLPAGTARRAWAELPRTRFTNAYGPTECATIATTYTLAGEAAILETVPIGRPIGNTRVYVLDGHGEPTPIGVPGEICLGGDGVAPGYWRRPELTRQSFVPDPWVEGATIYRTGDLGRYRADGELEFLGRADRQVKVGGYRVEPAEVEAALARHPAVAAVVALVLGTGEDARLVAFAETGPASAANAAELTVFLAARLPRHLLPARVEPRERFPLTARGKIDLDALARSVLVRDADERDDREPRSALEALLAGIWAEVLGVEAVGVGTDFFALGGHSLAATRLLSRVRDALQTSVTMREFFDRPTVRGLALLLARDEQTVRRAELLARLGELAAAGAAAVAADPRSPAE
jgi:amino acid adenylation domain-containing protein